MELLGSGASNPIASRQSCANTSVTELSWRDGSYARYCGYKRNVENPQHPMPPLKTSVGLRMGDVTKL